jgi:hypothetical protein
MKIVFIVMEGERPWKWRKEGGEFEAASLSKEDVTKAFEAAEAQIADIISKRHKDMMGQYDDLWIKKVYR